MNSSSPSLLDPSELNSPHSLRAHVRADEAECGIETVLRRAEARMKTTADKYREEIRHHPGRSVIAAAAGGYMIHRLPLGAMLATGLKLAAAFTPPTLIALGICKVAEYCKRMDRRAAATELMDGKITAGRVVATDAAYS